MATPFIGSFAAKPNVALDTSRIQELGAERTTLENQLKQRQLGIAQAQMVGDVSNNLARTVNQQRLMEPEIERLNRTLDSTVERQNAENDNQALQNHLQYQGHLENRARILDALADRARADADSAKTGAITAALYLKEFVPDDVPWAHFDMMAWNNTSRPGRPEGGEAQAARAIFAAIEKKFG